MKEKIYFHSTQNISLCGILSNPSPNKTNPVIILCHGFSTSKDGRTNLNLERIFNSQNLATFRFDFFGHGESGGKFEDITVSEAVDDVLQAINLVRESGFAKIGLFGSSFGGMASIIAASRTEDLYVLALKSPVSDYMGKLISKDHDKNIGAWKEQGFIDVLGAEGQNLKLNYSFFEDAQKVRGYEAAEKISTPTIIVHGDRDETVPLEQSLRLSGLLKNGRLEILAGADHIYSQPRHFDRMLQLISEFVLDHSKKAING